MPDDGRLAPGPYPTPPAPWQRDKFLELVRDTGMPEDIPQLCKTPPDPSLEHVHVCRIDVPRKKRPNGRMIPCSFCTHNKPKFLDGHLIWSSDGHIRLLGNCCGPKFFGDLAYREITEKAERERRAQANQEFLLEKLPNVPLLLTDVEVIEPFCRAFQQEMRKFHREVPSLVNQLSRMARENSSNLIVVTERSGHGPGGIGSSLGDEQGDFIVQTVGRLRGESFIRAGFNPVGALKEVRQDLEDLVPDLTVTFGPDEVLDVVCGMSWVQLERETMRYRRATRRMAALIERLGDLRLFLSDENLQQLIVWSEHPDCPIPFSLEASKSRVSFRVSWQEHVTLPRGGRLSPPRLQHAPRIFETDGT